jgi:hypothetical protein
MPCDRQWCQILDWFYEPSVEFVPEDYVEFGDDKFQQQIVILVL